MTLLNAMLASAYTIKTTVDKHDYDQGFIYHGIGLLTHHVHNVTWYLLNVYRTRTWLQWSYVIDLTLGRLDAGAMNGIPPASPNRRASLLPTITSELFRHAFIRPAGHSQHVGLFSLLAKHHTILTSGQLCRLPSGRGGCTAEPATAQRRSLPLSWHLVPLKGDVYSAWPRDQLFSAICW